MGTVEVQLTEAEAAADTELAVAAVVAGLEWVAVEPEALKQNGLKLILHGMHFHLPLMARRASGSLKAAAKLSLKLDTRLELLLSRGNDLLSVMRRAKSLKLDNLSGSALALLVSRRNWSLRKEHADQGGG